MSPGHRLLLPGPSDIFGSAIVLETIKRRLRWVALGAALSLPGGTCPSATWLPEDSRKDGGAQRQGGARASQPVGPWGQRWRGGQDVVAGIRGYRRVWLVLWEATRTWLIPRAPSGGQQLVRGSVLWGLRRELSARCLWCRAWEQRGEDCPQPPEQGRRDGEGTRIRLLSRVRVGAVAAGAVGWAQGAALPAPLGVPQRVMLQGHLRNEQAAQQHLGQMGAETLVGAAGPRGSWGHSHTPPSLPAAQH